MRLVIVDNNAARAAQIASALQAAGVEPPALLAPNVDLTARLIEHDPDVVLIDLDSPSRDVLEQMFAMTRALRRPVAMFVGAAGAPSIVEAIEAGVGAYVVDGLRPERVKAVLDLAVARFGAFSRMQAELDAAKAALEARKTIDRAKGLLMKARGLNESEAYALLRTTAMNKGKRILEVAESLLDAAELLR